MPSIGGRYRIKNGKPQLVHETKPAPATAEGDKKAQAAQPAGKSAKPAAKKEDSGNE
ncbi:MULTISPECIES: hypothetical protein [unclassified Halomonas]|uniref:hypothetical protein n=1 Tax=unclassified Halomonas TaxID=2609666 RepID=UPI002076A8A9|nr:MULTISPECIES: hypothetical protein [unclassified Halomonas]